MRWLICSVWVLLKFLIYLLIFFSYFCISSCSLTAFSAFSRSSWFFFSYSLIFFFNSFCFFSSASVYFFNSSSCFFYAMTYCFCSYCILSISSLYLLFCSLTSFNYFSFSHNLSICLASCLKCFALLGASERNYSSAFFWRSLSFVCCKTSFSLRLCFWILSKDSCKESLCFRMSSYSLMCFFRFSLISFSFRICYCCWASFKWFYKLISFSISESNDS